MAADGARRIRDRDGPHGPTEQDGSEAALGHRGRLRRRVLGGLAAMAAGGAAIPAGLPAMLRRPIPGRAEALPVVGLGTWIAFDVEGAEELAEARETLAGFVAGGGAVVDSSPMYGRAESVVGRLAADLGADRLFLATKVWTEGREAGIRQMEESLRRLRATRADLMQVHNLVDAAVHVRTLREWKAAGRVRYWGLTHHHAGAHGELERWMRSERPDFIQINYSLAEPEAGRRLLPLAAELGVGVIANRPFAEGALFRRVRGRPLPPWAGDLGVATWAQFFLKWILGDAAVTCTIPATRRSVHLVENLAAGTGRLPSAAERERMARFVVGE